MVADPVAEAVVFAQTVAVGVMGVLPGGPTFGEGGVGGGQEQHAAQQDRGKYALDHSIVSSQWGAEIGAAVSGDLLFTVAPTLGQCI